MDEVYRFLFCDVPVHLRQHMVGDMLQGDVQILAHIVVLTHHVKQFQWELVGIGIVKSYPFHALDVCHFVDKLSYPCLAIKITAIIGEFLFDDLKFSHSLTYKLFHLFQNVFHWPAYVLSRYEWDGAVSAVAVTPLGNLDISIVRRSGEKSTSVGGNRSLGETLAF